MSEGEEQAIDGGNRAAPRVVARHRLSTRIWHWVNALTLLVMVMSGMMIFNAHPRLYWGQYGANADPAWLEIGARGESGYLRVGSVAVTTTGVLGRWRDGDGIVRKRAFPGWATIPSHYSLADGRLWHLFFAWILALSLLAYMIRSLFNGHVHRDLATDRRDWSPRHLWHEIRDHARLRFATGAAATRYNSLQKFSYIGVIFVLLPLMIFTGLALSPGFDAVLSPYVDLFGGRQSARSIHFIGMGLLIGFFIVHIAMVIAAGPINEVRSMITGRYRLPRDREDAARSRPPP
ncbi:hypothetical protein FSZ31_02545 [Sphingorhabdus soli]|uniref:Cytochrome b561 bacterial/Ni-hydrogenase domain-containing protein n=1 Tax=Flavisphingopyxis soli TaxID=2601267 RepID=A0A5C6ULC7_9SPHN|nr:cytochrome b/b6 domain-containing protein [Sphingorhabdus soli]TXC73639.1 hypothetical protein FSZ31_02545 [Sphingorhabdus soli]